MKFHKEQPKISMKSLPSLSETFDWNVVVTDPTCPSPCATPSSAASYPCGVCGVGHAVPHQRLQTALYQTPKVCMGLQGESKMRTAL